MQKVLLISNYVFHYRLNNYNFFAEEFKKLGFEFSLLTHEAQKVPFEIKYPLIEVPKKFSAFRKAVNKIKPDVIILFAHLKDLHIHPLTCYLKIKRIPFIYWNFGINTDHPDAYLKNALYRLYHTISKSIILYSPNEIKYIKEKNRRKVFIGNNSVNLTDIDASQFTDKDYLRKKYHIKESKIVLFVGLISKKAKKLDILLQCFRNQDIAVVIAGKGMNDEQLGIVNSQANYYYLGEISYDRNEIYNIYKSADVFCIPGNVGLSIIEAFFMGKPVFTMEFPNEVNSPELWYLKNGENGYIASSREELESKIIEVLGNPEMYQSFCKLARETYDTQAHIKFMFEGFKNAVNYALDSKKRKNIP